MKKARVFVIHSEKDQDAILALKVQYNDQVFTDDNGEITVLNVDYVDSKQEELLGKDFGEEIKRKIDKSNDVIVLITPNCCGSIWVNQEIGFVLGKNRNFIPIIEKGMIGKSFGFI